MSKDAQAGKWTIKIKPNDLLDTAPVIAFGVDMTSWKYECPLAFFGLVWGSSLPLL